MSGKEMSDIQFESTAIAAHAWIEDAVPDTKPKTPDVVRAELYAGDGIAAFDDNGEPAGYVARFKFHDLGGILLAGAGGVLVTLRRVPHFGIQSLVVNPDKQGNGLGRRLIRAAEAAAVREVTEKGDAYDHLPDFKIALVSAVAAQASIKSFHDNGFRPNASKTIAKAHRYSDFRPLAEKKQFVHKWVGVPTAPGNRNADEANSLGPSVILEKR